MIIPLTFAAKAAAGEGRRAWWSVTEAARDQPAMMRGDVFA
jgi:hypothetical protein